MKTFIIFCLCKLLKPILRAYRVLPYIKNQYLGAGWSKHRRKKKRGRKYNLFISTRSTHITPKAIENNIFSHYYEYARWPNTKWPRCLRKTYILNHIHSILSRCLVIFNNHALHIHFDTMFKLQITNTRAPIKIVHIAHFII